MIPSCCPEIENVFYRTFFSCPPYNSWNSSYVLNFPATPSHDNQIFFFPVDQESRNNRDQCPLSPYSIYLMCAHLLHLLYSSRPKPSHLLKAMATSFLFPSPYSTQILLLTASAEITQYVVVSTFMSRGEHLPPLPASTPPPPSFSILYNTPKVKLTLVSCKLTLKVLALVSGWYCIHPDAAESKTVTAGVWEVPITLMPQLQTKRPMVPHANSSVAHVGFWPLQLQIAPFHHH